MLSVRANNTTSTSMLYCDCTDPYNSGVASGQIPLLSLVQTLAVAEHLNFHWTVGVDLWQPTKVLSAM